LEWLKAGRIIRWLREAKVKAVALGGYNDLGRLRLIHWGASHGVPVLFFADSNIAGDATAGWRAAVKRFLLPPILRRCAAVLPCGSRGREYFTKYGVDSAECFYFPYEPDYAPFREGPIDLSSHAPFFPTGRRRLLFCGRLVAEKRPDLVLDAFTAIAVQRPDWDLVMLGSGPLSDSLRTRVPEVLRSRVVWTGFVGAVKEVASVFRACDVLVLPSDYEPWAVVVNEACAAGLALVCTSVVGAAAELVCDGVNGRLFPPGDGQALQAALLDVTDAGKLTSMKGASARVLNAWQQRGDPVAGFRRALEFVRVLPSQGARPSA
jgi:glycosyltransferase involved in cell wall biosynthesis